jgi:Tol biopolymer transport system component
MSPSVSPDGRFIASIGIDDKAGKFFVVPFGGGPQLQEFSIAPMKPSSHRLRWTADSSAFMYVIKSEGVAGIYKQPLHGGNPEKIAAFNDGVSDFDYSADDQRLAVIRSGWSFDFLLISDFNRL